MFIQNTYQQKKSIATIPNFNPFVCTFSKYPLSFYHKYYSAFKKSGIGNWCLENILKIQKHADELFVWDIRFSLQLYNCNNYVWNYCSTHVLICTDSIVSRHYSHNFTSLMFFLVKVKFDTSFYERVDKSFKSFD